MNFHHPDRPRLGNGRPAWITSPQTALPGLYVVPLPDRSDGQDWIQVSLMLEGRWVDCKILQQFLPELVYDWCCDPEATLLEWWNRSPPTSHQQQSLLDSHPTSTLSAEELGL